MAVDASSFLIPWLTFYGMTGTSAATLTGLMFVVITLVSGEQRPTTTADGGATFTTPTVMHFGAALLVSALLVAPWRSLWGPAALLGIAGLYCTFHMARVTIKARRLTAYRPDAEDWAWYSILPSVAYLTLLGGAIALPASPGAAMFVFGAAVVMLIFIGIRNSWDVVTYITVGRGVEPPHSSTS